MNKLYFYVFKTERTLRFSSSLFMHMHNEFFAPNQAAPDSQQRSLATMNYVPSNWVFAN